MGRVLLSLIFIFTSIAQANTNAIYANIYADFLIDEFDKSLAEGRGENILYSQLYSRILAARNYIENNGKILPTKSISVVQLIDSKKYEEIRSEIDNMAEEILLFQKRLKEKTLESNLVVYPSIGPDGNLTGNTFPENVWSLTFDDGPREERTEVVVDNLYLYNFRASFFMLMRQVNKFPKSAQYVIDHHMDLALHSYNHLDLNKESKDVMSYEVKSALSELEDFSKRKVKLFRLPYGSGMRNKVLRKMIQDANLVHVFWNVDSLDWKDKDPESVFKRVVAQMHLTPKKSGIILFHDIHAQTLIASKLVMEYLKNENKTVCTVGDVVSYFNGVFQDCLKN